jgi:ankyrin repeat protein
MSQINPVHSIAEDHLQTAFQNAIKRGDIAAVRLFIDQGADVNASDTLGWTPLHFVASENTTTEIIRVLVDRGADVNAKTCQNCTPLHRAVLNSNIKITEFLVFKGAFINARCTTYGTPLDLAKQQENLQVVDYLSSIGAEETIKSSHFSN